MKIRWPEFIFPPINLWVMPKSPCIKECKYCCSLDMCTGCGRTLREIQGWREMNRHQQKVVKELAARRLKG